jgi:type IV pilus assembly protein PilF
MHFARIPRASRPVLAALLACLVTIAPARADDPTTRESKEQAAAVNTELALTYLRDGNLAAARDKIEKALTQNSRTAKTQMAAGFIYDRLGESKKAASHFEQAVKLGGKDNPDVLNNAAVFYCRSGEYKRGEEYLLQAATSPLYRTPEVAYVNAGRCALADRRAKDAEQHFRKALAINAKQPDALWQMAELAQANGNGLQARAFLERYSAVAPPTAATLWLGRKVELGLGDTAQAARYEQQLKDRFPTSQEVSQLYDEERSKP